MSMVGAVSSGMYDGTCGSEPVAASAAAAEVSKASASSEPVIRDDSCGAAESTEVSATIAVVGFTLSTSAVAESRTPESGQTKSRSEVTPRMLSTMSAGRVSAVAVNSGLATEVTAARSAWANGTAVVHIEDARVFTRPSHWLAASLPRPSCDGPVGSDELSATRYPRVMFSTVIRRSGSIARQSASVTRRSESLSGLVAFSTASTNASRRPPSESSVASSSSIRRTGSLTAPGIPPTSRGASASGHMSVTPIGADVSGGTTAVADELGVPAVAFDSAAAGTPRTGSRKRASSSRAAPPYSGVPFTLTSIG